MLRRMTTQNGGCRHTRTLKRAAIALLPVAGILVTWFGILPKTKAWYRDGRPTRFGTLTNRAMGRYAASGIPAFGMVTLEVPGRTSGKMTSTVLAPSKQEGRTYLISMLGERSHWVHNVRASGGHAVIRHGKSRPVMLVEVPESERAPILCTYLRKTPGAHAHFPLRTDAPIEAFEPLAGEYPVFEVLDAQGNG